ncbi:MAG: tRNA (adenosine(37)-N6)-dimethylallyltransferase MiaA [Flavobacteriales bacterium]|nr:tRNA (adenosine(37)-N6)-dimethylallyltransferase MiaA [Flavobacteriales bacterium]
MKKHLIVIAGPTGIGKTDLSIGLARHYQAEIISCDSRQFYKEMNIGTAVPSKTDLTEVKHHFIQNLSIKNHYTVGDFEKDALAKIEDLHQENDVVIMVGGSGLYIDAVCKGLDDFPKIPQEIRTRLNERLVSEGIESLEQELIVLDPDYHKVVDVSNPHRIIRALEVCISSGKPFSSFRKRQKKTRRFKTIKIILNRNRETLYERINLRVNQMMKEGLLEEARNLLPFRGYNALQTVGYKELFAYFDGEWNLETAIEEIKKNTRRYAKRQMTWFRRDPETLFFNPEEESDIKEYLKEQIKD